MKKKTCPIKLERKKSLYLQEFLALFRSLAQDEPSLSTLYPTRVEFSNDCGICYIFFSCYDTTISDQNQESLFIEKLEILKLYKPSMRKALSNAIHTRYIPNLVFRYDKHKEKVDRLNDLLQHIETELKDHH